MDIKEKEYKPSAFALFNQEKSKELWSKISENEDASLSSEFIEANIVNLDWKALSFNDSLPWSVKFIKQYKKLWDWHALSFIIADKNFFERSDFEILLKQYKENVDWEVICQGTNLNIYQLTDYAQYINWDALSSNCRFMWSESFINEHIEKINWKIFTESLATIETSSLVLTSFRKKVLDLYSNKLDFAVLSENDSLDFTPDIIEKYKKCWNWTELINNPAIEWDEAMFKKYDKYISTIPPEELKVSFMWTSLIEQDSVVEALLALL